MDHQRCLLAEARTSHRARLRPQRMQPNRNDSLRQRFARGNCSRPFPKMILLPASGDNAGIATRRLEKGATFDVNGSAITVRQTVLEGHRVATTPIDAGQLI